MARHQLSSGKGIQRGLSPEGVRKTDQKIVTVEQTLENTIFKNDAVSCSLSQQDIRELTDWRIASDKHCFIVHRAGDIPEMESELDGCGALLSPPMLGDVTFIPAGTRYACQARGSVVEFAELQIDAFPLLKSVAAQRKLNPFAGRFDPLLFQMLEDLIHIDGELPEQDFKLNEIADHLKRVYASESSSEGNRPERYKFSKNQKTRLEEIIKEQLDQKLSLAQLASAVSMSVNNFLVRFQNAFGKTPSQFIIESRLRKARWLMHSTQDDLLTIAIKTGFGSHSHLTRTFAARYQMTPTLYRHQIL